MADHGSDPFTDANQVVEDMPDFESDVEEVAAPAPAALVVTNPCLTTASSKAINNHRPFNSARSLATFFGATDANAFRTNITRRVGSRFARVYQGVMTLKNTGRTGVQWVKVAESLAAARESSTSSITSGSYDTSRLWTIADWIAHFVYFARLSLFADDDPTSFASVGIPVSLHDDRAYSTWLLLYKWRSDVDRNKEKRQNANKKPEAQADESNMETEHTTTATGNAKTTPKETTMQTNTVNIDGMEWEINNESYVLGNVLRRIAERQEAEDAAMSAQTDKAHLQSDVAVEMDPSKLLEEYTFAGGSIVEAFGDVIIPRVARPARELDGLVGDDTNENPLSLLFYRIRDDVHGNARLIGADHLHGVDPNQEVDWEDDFRIDRKNCSTHLLADYVHQLEKIDKAQAQEVVEEVEAAARQGDVFAQKHLKVLQPHNMTATEQAQEHIGEMFQADHDFSRTRFKLLAKCSEYNKKNAELRDMMTNATVTNDITSNVTEANAHENQVTVTTAEATQGIPTGGQQNTLAEETSTQLVQIDTDDPVWRKRQKELLGAFVDSTIPAEEYREALSTLHIANRSEPRMPGQTGSTLLWSQTVAIAKGIRRARKRMMEGRGARGMIIGHATGLGKSNIGLGIMLSAINERAFELQEMRDRRDFRAMANYKRRHPAKINIWVTDTHLISQAATDAYRFSSAFVVYVYRNERDKSFSLPIGVRQLTTTMDIRDELFDENNVLKANIIVIMSKGTLSARHGPRPAAQFGKMKGDLAIAVAKSANKYLDLAPPGFPKDLAGHVGLVLIDEGHNIGGEDADTWIAIRWLNADFHIILTATPVPWSGEKLVSLIRVIQDPELDEEASRLDRRDQLQNPYEESLSPDDPLCRFQGTRTAFKKFYLHDADCVEQGRVISLVLRDTMTRGTYQSTCVTHPNGDVHSLQDLMPISIPIRLHIENNEITEEIWDNESSDAFHKLHLKDPMAPEAKADKVLINGKYQRLLNLGSFCVLLFFAMSIHDVTDETSVNPTIIKYRDLHDNNKYADYLWNLLEDIYHEGVVLRGNLNLFPFKGEDADRCRMPRRNAPGELVWAFVSRSERLKLLLALMADWVARLGQKVIIWCSNPTEQELVNCLLNLCGVRSVALLARYAPADKANIIDRFKKPLAASVGRATTASERDQEIETLVLSTKQSTGLNLQDCAHLMIFMGPASSDSEYCQCCGRIIRIGQEHACIIIDIYDPKSFNSRVFAKAVRHALPNLVANVNISHLRQIFTTQEDENDNPQNVAVSSEGLQGYVKFPDGRILHQDDPMAIGSNEAISLEPRELISAIFAQINSQSYAVRRDQHQVQFQKTEHAHAARPNIANTPKKYPGLQGDRSHRNETLLGISEDMDGHMEPEEGGLVMDVEVDAPDGETQTLAVKKAQTKKRKMQRRLEDQEMGDSWVKRRRIRQGTVAGASEKLGYALDPRYDMAAALKAIRFIPPLAAVEQDVSENAPDEMETLSTEVSELALALQHDKGWDMDRAFEKSAE